MYNNVVERCFRDCVESFRRKDLESSEERVRGLMHVLQMLVPGIVPMIASVSPAVCDKMLRKVHEAFCQGRNAIWRAIKSSRATNAAGYATANRALELVSFRPATFSAHAKQHEKSQTLSGGVFQTMNAYADPGACLSSNLIFLSKCFPEYRESQHA